MGLLGVGLLKSLPFWARLASAISEGLNMNAIFGLLPEWAWIVILIALSFAFFMLSLAFVIQKAVEKAIEIALGAKLKQINDSINELQHIRDDLKMLRKLGNLVG
jgi:hypothetical protein